MAKTPKLQKTGVAPSLTDSKPEIPAFIPLVMEERDRLSVILKDPVFIKAWNNAECYKPSAFPFTPGKFDGKFGGKAASNALHLIQGWELHRTALIRQSLEPVHRRYTPKEDYPDSGTLESEVAASLAKNKSNQPK